MLWGVLALGALVPRNVVTPEEACRSALYAPPVLLRFRREGRSEEYRLQYAVKAAKQVCAQSRRSCDKFGRAVESATLVGLVDYDGFCDGVFGTQSPFRPLFGQAAPNTVGQKHCEAVLADSRDMELSPPHAVEWAAFALCAALPEHWRLPRRASLLVRWPFERRAFLQARGVSFLQERQDRRNPFERAVDAAAHRFLLQKETHKDRRNPFERAWDFASRNHFDPPAKEAHAKPPPPAKPHEAHAKPPPPDEPREALTPHKPAMISNNTDRSAQCLVFQKFVGALLASGDLPPDQYCESMGEHYAAANVSAFALRPDSPAVLFRGTPLGMCASRLAVAAQAGSPDLPGVARGICQTEVEELRVGVAVDCESFAEFVQFLAQKGDVTEASFCSLFSPDWGTFSSGGAWSYDKCLQSVPPVLSMDVSTDVLASSVFDVCAGDGPFDGAKAGRALACAPLRTAVLDLRPKGLMLPETVCHSLSVSLHADTYAFDTCATRVESITSLQLDTKQQADLLQQDCTDAPFELHGAHAGDCAWVKQTFLDLAGHTDRVSGNMLCSLLEDVRSDVEKCTAALGSSFRTLTSPEQKVALAQQECVQIFGDAAVCARFAQLLSASPRVEPPLVCAELVTREGLTARRAWVATCVAQLKSLVDTPLSALCFQPPLSSHQEQCEHVLAGPDAPREPVEVCEAIWGERDAHECLLSAWTPWSACSANCGTPGVRTRRRQVLHAQHGCKGHSLVATAACSPYGCAGKELAGPPELKAPLVCRGPSSFWVSWDLPSAAFTRLTVVVQKDGGGEVFRQDVPVAEAQEVQVGNLESATRYSVELLAEYSGTVRLRGSAQRVVAFAQSPPAVASTLEKLHQARCGLNGISIGGACVCAEHWTGDMCETKTAMPQLLWRSSPWSSCTSECGGGEQIRSVRCVQVGGQRTERRPDYECPADAQPLTRRACRESPCDAWAWTATVAFGNAAEAYLLTHLAERSPDQLEVDLGANLAAALGVDRSMVSVGLKRETAFGALETAGGLLEAEEEKPADAVADDDADEDEPDDAVPSFLQTEVGVALTLEITGEKETVRGAATAFAAQLRHEGSPLLATVPFLRRVHPGTIPGATLVQLTPRHRHHDFAEPVVDAQHTAAVLLGQAQTSSNAFVRAVHQDADEVKEAVASHASAQRDTEKAEIVLHAKAVEVLEGRENSTSVRNRFGDPSLPAEENAALAESKPGGAGWLADSRGVWAGARDEIFRGAAYLLPLGLAVLLL